MIAQIARHDFAAQGGVPYFFRWRTTRTFLADENG